MFTIALISFGLAMDCFAASLSAEKIGKIIHALKVALFFGLFQGTMPIVGSYITGSFKVYVSSIDHWMAFAILSFIGLKMILSFKEDKKFDIFNTKTLVILSFATSIDALFAGFVLTSMDFSILEAGLVIGLITAILSFFGILLSKGLKKGLKNYSVILGGVILIAIGLKILISHLTA